MDANKKKEVITICDNKTKRSEQFFCWNKKGLLSKQCNEQCNICFRYERNNKKNCT